MAWSKPFTDEEKETIRELRSQLTPAEIAKRLGRSRRGVETVISKLDDGAPHARAWCQPEEDESRGAVSDLRALARRLEAAMETAGPGSLPRLAREYRETVMQIEALEGASGEHDEQGDPNALVATISLRSA